MNPWPLHAEPTTTGPRRSRMKLSSAVFVYRQVSAWCGLGWAPGNRSDTQADIRSTTRASTLPRSSGLAGAPE